MTSRILCPRRLLSLLLFSAAILLVPDAGAQTAPSNCVAANTIIDASNVEIRVRWLDNSTNENGFQIGYIIGSPTGTVTSFPGYFTAANATEISFPLGASILTAGTQIYWFVRAFIGTAASPTSNSAWSNASGFAWPNAAAQTFNAPTGLNASSSGEGLISISFTDNSNSEWGYELHIRAAGASTYTYLGDVDFNDTSVTFNWYASPVDLMVRGFKGSTKTYTGQAERLNFGFNALNAPTNLTFTSLVAEQIVLNWTDNSTVEGNYKVEYRFVGNANFTHLAYLNGNSTTYTVTSVPPSPIEFRVLATRGAGPDFFSNPSNVVTATASLATPTNFTATVVGESTVNFTWTDTSSLEHGFYVLAKESGATQFSILASAAANATSLSVPDMIPGLTYDFAIQSVYVRAANDEVGSALSTTVTRSLPFNAPTALSAVAATDRQINLTWTDNSASESGHIVYCKPSTASTFQACGVVGPNVTTFSTKFVDAGAGTPLAPNTAYQFEVRAFAALSLAVAQSNPAFVDSNAVRSSATTGAVTTKDGVTADLSPPMLVNQAFSHTFIATQGQSSISSSSITGTLPPGITYNSGTRTLSGTPTARGSFTPSLTVNWANGWSSTQTIHLRPYFQPGRPVVVTPIANHTISVGDSPLSIPLASTFSDPDTESAVAISLPGADGTPGARSITIILNDSVTPVTVANFRAYLNNASNGYTGSVFHRLINGFVLQGGAFRSSPLVNAASNALVGVTKLAPIQNEPGLPNIAGTLAMAKQGGNPNSATTDFFFNLADNTSNLDFQNEGFSVFGRVAQPSLSTLGALASLPLPPAAANGQPANYQVLIDAVVVNSTMTSGSTTVVPSSFASIVAGQGVSGTGVPPNTYVTAVNGTTNITISNAATVTSTAPLSYGAATAFSEMPYNAATAPAPPIDASKLVRINSVTSSVPILSGYTASSSSTGVATTSLTGTNLSLSPVAPGTSTISLQVTDLDGNQLQTPLTFQVTVNNTLSNWASTEGLASGQDGPDADPDQDGRKNLLEYALMSSPGTANGSADPALNTVTEGADKKATITFKVRKFAALTYTVEAASSFNSWTPIWTSTSGFAVPAVSAAVNNADHTLVTIKDSVPYSDTTPRFLRLKVTSP